MDNVIDDNQSAFVPGRLITDNILIGFECMHWLRNSKSKDGYAALKLDMSKAYDWVEWRFIEAIMAKLGFSQKWRSLTLRCITSITYALKFHGIITNKIFLKGDLGKEICYHPIYLLYAPKGCQRC